MMNLAELIVRILIFLVGAYIVFWTLLSVMKSFVLPRAVNTLLTRLVFRWMLRIFNLRLRKVQTYLDRDRVMAMYAPLCLLTLPVVWLILVLVGYMLMYFAVGVGSMLDAFRLSGSSLLTLGFAMDPQTMTLILEFSEAAIGLILVAVLIAYLPTMYAAFSRREAMVNLLEVRAGSPPTPTDMIMRIHRVRGLEYLHDLWEDWERWFVDLEESHTTFAPLVFFRSPQPNRSWVTAAGAVLDTASFVNAAIDIPHDPQADLTIRAGFLALRRIADFFRIAYNDNPSATDPISISRDEFNAVYDALLENGVPMKPDRDQAWRDYAGWRVNYDRVLLSIAALTMAPYAPWVSDRSIPYLPTQRHHIMVPTTTPSAGWPRRAPTSNGK